MDSIDVRIVGSGVVSRVLALALAHEGLRVALQARPTPGTAERRAYALSAASVALLQRLKVWDALAMSARTEVAAMRVHGDAPLALIEFSAQEQGVPALAWIVQAGALEQALETAVGFAPRVSRHDEPPAAELTVIAQGKTSPERQRRGVGWSAQPYGQQAVTAWLRSDQPHAGVARQWFRSPDVLALLPQDEPEAGRSFSLVWSMPEAQAQAMLALPASEFEARLFEATGAEAGSLRLDGERQAWPLMQGRAQALCGPGWALVGDAAHAVHPLAGQGLNLGLSDVSALVQVLVQRESWRHLGDEALLRRYARARHVPTQRMMQATDGLWHLFGHPHPLVRELRNHGLTLVHHLAPLKRWLVRQATQG